MCVCVLVRVLSVATPSVLQPVRCVLTHSNGSSDEIQLLHTMNQAQIEWFKAGSALNRMAQVL